MTEKGIPEGKRMISTTAEYGLRAAVYLAMHHGTPKTTAEIAEATMVPAGYLAKVLQAMGRHHLVGSQRGLGGGFHLTRPPQEITVLDVLAAVDSPIQRITRCPLGLKSHMKLCPVHRLVDDAIRTVEEAFAQATLFSLLQSTRGSVKPLCEVHPQELIEHQMSSGPVV